MHLIANRNHPYVAGTLSANKTAIVFLSNDFYCGLWTDLPKSTTTRHMARKPVVSSELQARSRGSSPNGGTTISGCGWPREHLGQQPASHWYTPKAQ